MVARGELTRLGPRDACGTLNEGGSRHGDAGRRPPMDKSALLERIVSDPKVMVGKPVIRGTRLTVQYILGLLAQSSTVQDILEEYSGLTPEDIQACLLFASEILEDTSFAPLPTGAW